MGHLVERRAIAHRTLVIGLALLLVGMSCGDAGGVRQTDLVRDSAHQIRMPDAVELAHVGNDRRSTIDH